MSVPMDRRNEGRLDVNTKAKELCVYTLRITANKKVFMEEQDAFTQMLREAALDIHLKCWEANNIRVDSNMERYKRRIELQARAIDKCTALCAMIDLAKPLFHLTTKRTIFWMDKVTALREMIRAWRANDVHRLKPAAA